MSTDCILVVNSGSSSLKFAIFRPGSQDEEEVLHGSSEGFGREGILFDVHSSVGQGLRQELTGVRAQNPAFDSAAVFLSSRPEIRLVAIGHRIVHGGPQLLEHQEITDAVQAKLAGAQHFAPLHIPAALKLIKGAAAAFPHVRQFACFDTVFHKTMPEVAKSLPLPKRFRDQGVMRFGFHGLSCEAIVRHLGDELPSRTVIAHLGSGASVTAILNGRSIDTSMSFSPTGGIMMGTRSGDLDPGALLYLLRSEQMNPEQLEDIVNRESGLRALSNGESDMRILLEGASRGDPAMAFAVESFCLSVRKQIGAFATLLEGLDLIVFTGGIGAHSSTVRSRICTGLKVFGVEEGSSRVSVLEAAEELQIARHTRKLLRRGAPLKH